MRLFRRSQVKPRPSSAAAAGSAPAVAEALLLAGASVMLIDRDPKSTAETVQSLSDLGRASSTIGDVSDRAAAEDAVSTAIDRLSAVDILANHAQALRPGVPLIATTEADFRLALDSGLWGTFNVMQLCYPHLANGGGAVINFASSAGIMGQAGMAAYAATKEAIRGMSRVAARERSPVGITVNFVCPATLGPAAKHGRTNIPICTKRSFASVRFPVTATRSRRLAPPWCSSPDPGHASSPESHDQWRIWHAAMTRPETAPGR